MSKEVTVIVLGFLLVIQTQFGIPDAWHTFLVVFLGGALVVTGFFLRTEALARGDHPHEHAPFVDNTAAAPETHQPHHYDRKEGITSLN
jgi:hypothetical protein